MPADLDGRRVLVLRPEGLAEKLTGALQELGAEPVVVPAIRILPPADWAAIESALARPTDWTVFTSVNGVEMLGDRLTNAHLGSVAAVGPATAAALTKRGIGLAFVPSAYTTVALARELPDPPATVRLLRADVAGGDLERILTDRGFTVERLDVYRTQPSGGIAIAAALEQGVDAVALTSASIARAYAAAAPRKKSVAGVAPSGHPLIFSIGPATSAAATELGLTVAAEAAPHTVLGLVEAMVVTLGSAASSQLGVPAKDNPPEPPSATLT